ncbi:CPI_1c_G0052240.mRNA.1.CDS.1 [Saccharomyces cerevisiae]|nr:CPI_1c_G0052240.mRNA.1.CDS.1 [Saccharomyces cerevisiae]CAI7470957.1 CPI_1c_G0052240.mRNA.1.CDS.1 [Saccharomyces cerevisiae]
MVLTYTSAQRRVFTQYGLCKGCQRYLSSVFVGLAGIVSRMAEALEAVERMLRNDEEYKEYLRHRHIMGLVIFEIF